MNILWVLAHPDERSLNGSLRDSAITALADAGHTVEQSDLYRMAWNPVVTGEDYAHDPDERLQVATASSTALRTGTLAEEIVVEQEKLRRADAVVLQFPLWWFSMPAIMKGWIDRVFVEGFGYGIRRDTGGTRRYGDGLMAGTRAMIVTSMGGSEHTVSPRGINGSLDELLFPIQHGFLWYTGMSVLPPVLVPSADRIGPDEYEHAEKTLHDRLASLFTDDPIPFRHQHGGEYDEKFVLRPEYGAGDSGVRVHRRVAPVRG
ncbi:MULTISPECIES: NAD(P)H-dependent oxidoreductase [Rhodococcus]|uniref:NADPH:quinone reductase n=1 Tax=Rhodococcoides kyotonense TaxID=398843 RepID=A0A177YHV4_9NOCA|nr:MULTISPECIES: NAD(P)H-dependent oxidoreductase [Rhodococcus]NIL74662.1 FMN-dependent NADH-azoreductase [Rhodococcus sp. B10]OAK54688.1 NADPH:quinone reductase [Rhodococcus kyotonensis]